MKITLRDDSGSSETIDVDSYDEAEEFAESWVLCGDWGGEGAIVTAYIYDDDDDCIGSIEVEVEPDHAQLIRQVAESGCCGNDPDDHEWTREGEGGCDENPGVWSRGGTTLVFSSHCKNCGLHRTIVDPGTQHNPGECTTYKYSWDEQ